MTNNPDKTPSAESVEERAEMIDRARAFYIECEHFSCEMMVEFAQAEIERFIAEVEMSIVDWEYREAEIVRNVMQAVKNRLTAQAVSEGDDK